jgi:hypothetical protein
MDTFEAGCQGLGLALAAGMVLGPFRRRDQPFWIGAAVAAITGAALFGFSLTPEDHPAWPGWLVGAPAAVLAYAVSADIAGSARARAGEGGAGGIALYIVLAALALAGLCLLGPVALISILALLAVLFLFITRRRTAGEKYEGLRSLR